ncbi:MAG: serine protease [Planctomycetaceae bacterium]|nr:serine protease [Planctomycetaceae bacterium]|tara:strand:+ start:4030 stop:5181 length:1152 start_codon:yes stop_codon:yes gene_type:complete
MYSALEQEATKSGCLRFFLLSSFFTFTIVCTPFSASFAQVGPPPLSTKQRDELYKEIARQTASLESQIGLLKKIVKVVQPSVVHIEINGGGTRRNRFPDETGSGVVFQRGENFYVLTNRHLVRYADPDEVTIRFSDGSEIRPKNMWLDAGTDIAVLAIDASEVMPARIGNSQDLEMGDYILAIGSPFGLSHSVTFGIVSAKGRRDLELSTDGVAYQDFLQIDASINPGNSGGPLVNLSGEVVGINTAIASTSGRHEGVGFAIPITMAMKIADQLIEKGKVVRGFLGVSLDSRFSHDTAVRLGLKTPRGARVTGITENSAASRAEVIPGDVILRFNGTWIDSDDHLVNEVSMTPVGNPVLMTVFRDGEMVELTVTVGERDLDNR